MAEIINGVPIGDLPGIESVPDDSMLVVEFLGKAYHMPGAVLRQMIQDVLDSMGDSVDDVTEARLTAAIETVLSSGKYNGVSPSVEVLDEDDGTAVIHIIDAFGDKRYPVEVKGATDAVRYKPQSLTDAQKKQARENIDVSPGTITVKLSGSVTGGFDVVLNGKSVTNEPLDRLAEEGYRVVGVAISEVKVLNYKVPAGTLFEYTNVFEFEDNSVVGSQDTRRFVFRVQVDDCNFTLRCTDGVWGGILQPIQATFFLKRNNGVPFIQYNGKTILPEDANWLSVQLILCEVQHRPVFCFQGDMQFFTDNNTAIQPPWGTAFSLRINDDNDYYFATEYDGYELQLLISPDGFVNSARKTSVYKAVESKADDLKAEDGTLFLLSAGEPIGAGVPLPTGNADDSKIFIADLNTSTYEDIKAADDAGKICYALWGGYTACMLTTLSPESAIFTTLLDPHLGLYVKFTKGTVGVSDFGLTESHSVLYEPQSLTDAQKAQARENIGALSADDIDVNSIGSNVYVSGLFSAKYADIKAAYEAGKACFITYGALLCTMTVFDAEKAEFVGMLTPHIGMKGILYADGTYNFQYVHSNAVQTVDQSLTDDQKAQARTNIGALSTGDVDTVLQQAKDSGRFDGEDGQRGPGILVIYSTPTAYTEQVNGLTPAYRSTRALVIDHSGIDPIVGDVIQRSYYHYPVIYVDDTYVYMSNRFSIRGAVGATGKTAYAYAQDGGYTGTEAAFAAKLASDSEPLVVTLSGNDTDGYTADKTVAEIYAARTAGRDVYMVGGAVTYQLSYLNGSFAAFSYTMASRNAIEIISVIMMSGVAPTRIHQTIDDSYVKYTAQSLDEEYKLQARTNIGAAAAADIAKTASLGISNSAAVYVKISDFGSWGTGAWYQKGFAMLITSRAGEMVWVAISSDDSNTNAKAIRLLDTYSKIAAIYYSASESAVYVKANAWCNNINAHIISNINGDYVPTVAQASALPSDAVQITITEFGAGSGKTSIGDASRALGMTGSATRPTYNGADMALSSDISSGNANTSTMPLGFASRLTGAEWGNTIGTSFTSWNDPTGGAIDFRQDNPSSGKMSIKVDGRVYVNEGNNPVMGTELAGNLWGMTSPDGENNVWIRTTTRGIVPYQGGAAGSGHCNLGVSSWYFANAYIDNVYGSNFSGLAAKATADGNGRNIASTYATKDEVVTAAAPLRVNYDTATQTVDKTLSEIKAAWDAGRSVVLTDGTSVYPLSYVDASEVIFSGFSINANSKYFFDSVHINSSGKVRYYSYSNQ